MTKQYEIPKILVWEAYKQVRANAGAAGVDGQSIESFEQNLKGNLFKLWNRLSSGAYFPPPVRAVEIPKTDGSSRLLGIPTVADRVAQTVVKRLLEPRLEAIFHPDSFGYRPKRSAHDAVKLAKERTWKKDIVVDIDIKGFFDNLNHELLLKAVRRHVEEPWILKCIERWLTAPLEMTDGNRQERNTGTPQGGVISPLLANLFLHYAFDFWMHRVLPDVTFERYADDILVHCDTPTQATYVLSRIKRRLSECLLELHPTKTKIVRVRERRHYNRSPIGAFDFLGFTFKPRGARSKAGNLFTSTLPGISGKAAKRIRNEIRTWKLHLRSDSSLSQLAAVMNPKVRGWIQYYGPFYKAALQSVLKQLERVLNSWVRRKYKSLKRSKTRAGRFLGRIALENPTLFAHWTFGVKSYAE